MSGLFFTGEAGDRVYTIAASAPGGYADAMATETTPFGSAALGDMQEALQSKVAAHVLALAKVLAP